MSKTQKASTDKKKGKISSRKKITSVDESRKEEDEERESSQNEGMRWSHRLASHELGRELNSFDKLYSPTLPYLRRYFA
ncbi:hypothetical protein SUGI_0291480 [Cryptomeria japonica]|nr:hypothetical protein SUGI_0291480 [Cryptomeria japonica]